MYTKNTKIRQLRIYVFNTNLSPLTRNELLLGGQMVQRKEICIKIIQSTNELNNGNFHGNFITKKSGQFNKKDNRKVNTILDIPLSFQNITHPRNFMEHNTVFRQAGGFFHKREFRFFFRHLTAGLMQLWKAP